MDVVGAWSRHAREHFAHDVLRRHALHPQLRAEHEAVSQRGDPDRLHVVREDVVLASECSPTAGELRSARLPRGWRRPRILVLLGRDREIHAIARTLSAT